MSKLKNFEEWKEYDKNGKVIHIKDSTGYESWATHDEHGNMISYKNNVVVIIVFHI